MGQVVEFPGIVVPQSVQMMSLITGAPHFGQSGQVSEIRAPHSLHIISAIVVVHFVNICFTFLEKLSFVESV